MRPHAALRGDLLGSGVEREPDPRPRRSALGFGGWIYSGLAVYTEGVGKHLVDIDEVALAAARAELGTDTIKDTVNESLRAAASARAAQVGEALDVLAGFALDDRGDAWR